MDDILQSLADDWDRVSESYREADTLLEDPNRAFAAHNAANAILLRAGKPLKVSNLVRDARQTKAAAEIALPQIAAEVIEHVKSEYDSDPHISPPDRQVTGEQLVEYVRTRFEGAEAAHESAQNRGRYERAYDLAMRAYNDAKGRLCREGREGVSPLEQLSEAQREVLNLTSTTFQSTLPKGTRNVNSAEFQAFVSEVIGDE